MSTENTTPTNTHQLVLIDMTFPTMVWFLVKLTIAAIPAALILLVLGAIASGILSGMLAGMA